MKKLKSYLVCFGIAILINFIECSLPDQSVFDFVLNKENNQIIFPITLKEKTKLQVRILCESFQNVTEVSIKYKFTERVCRENSSYSDNIGFVEEERHKCQLFGPIILNRIEFQRNDQTPVERVKTKPNVSLSDLGEKDKSILSIVKDGIYILQMEMTTDKDDFNASVNIKFQSPYGLLTAKDLPMLGFYGFMCTYYFILATVWMIFSALHWKDLLRIQFWVGGVILLGMMEKACFYFEFHQANENGFSSLPLALIAELVSCVKRSLSRILVLIVSMGFGITKSRLGDEANVRISVISILYFSMASIESYLRIQSRDKNENRQLILSAVPLALIDSLICWWIFTSLTQTIRALKLRRNVVKLRFYNHFKNTLIFGVFMSVVFMLYSIKIHKTECAWKNLWIDQAFWHVLFSILLTVIAFLWRPDNNNHKYAFIPLLEGDNDEDDEQDEFVASNYSDTKMRSSKIPSQQHVERNDPEDDELKWVEDNIVSSSILLADSDEELMNTKFEISKMQ